MVALLYSTFCQVPHSRYNGAHTLTIKYLHLYWYRMFWIFYPLLVWPFLLWAGTALLSIPHKVPQSVHD